MSDPNKPENPLVIHSPLNGVMIDMVTFMEQEQVLQFQQDMELIKPSWARDPQYSQKIEAWQRVVAFPTSMVKTLNDKDNQAVVGTSNSSDGQGVENVTREDPNHNTTYDYVVIKK